MSFILATQIPIPSFCKVCHTKWGKQLWEGACVCSGHVTPGYKIPSGKNQIDNISNENNHSGIGDAKPLM